MKVKLTALERLRAEQLLPHKGNSVTLRLFEKAREVLILNGEEYDEFRAKTDKYGILDKDYAKQEKEIELGELVTETLIKILTEFEKKDDLEDKHLTLYEKFVEGEKSE